MADKWSYFPFLYCRSAEIKALGNLPSEVKDLILPYFLLRPWPNAKLFRSTLSKIQSAFSNRWVVLGLDFDFEINESKESHIEFYRLLDEKNGYENYYNLVKSEPNYLASYIVNPDSNEENDLKQIEHIKSIGRKVFVRIDFNNLAISYEKPIKFLYDNGIEFSVYIDLCWNPEYIDRETWAARVVEYIVSLNNNIEIIVSGSSFPNGFREIVGKGSISLKERYVFNNLKRNFNDARLQYGDWGSARPPAPPKPMRIIRRLDLPIETSWEVYRASNGESYKDLAEDVITNPNWESNVELWGYKMIEWTANGASGSISSPAIASAVRINIHMFIQSIFGGHSIALLPDEPVTDEI